MTPKIELDSTAAEVRMWRLRTLGSFVASVVLLVVMLVVALYDAPVGNDAVTACGSACGAARMRVVRRSSCECQVVDSITLPREVQR